jgi:hypothetical protein
MPDPALELSKTAVAPEAATKVTPTGTTPEAEVLLNPPVRVATVEPAEPTAAGKTNMY